MRFSSSSFNLNAMMNAWKKEKRRNDLEDTWNVKLPGNTDEEEPGFSAFPVKKIDWGLVGTYSDCPQTGEKPVYYELENPEEFDDSPLDLEDAALTLSFAFKAQSDETRKLNRFDPLYTEQVRDLMDSAGRIARSIMTVCKYEPERRGDRLCKPERLQDLYNELSCHFRKTAAAVRGAYDADNSPVLNGLFRLESDLLCCLTRLYATRKTLEILKSRPYRIQDNGFDVHGLGKDPADSRPLSQPETQPVQSAYQAAPVYSGAASLQGTNPARQDSSETVDEAALENYVETPEAAYERRLRMISNRDTLFDRLVVKRNARRMAAERAAQGLEPISYSEDDEDDLPAEKTPAAEEKKAADVSGAVPQKQKNLPQPEKRQQETADTKEKTLPVLSASAEVISPPEFPPSGQSMKFKQLPPAAAGNSVPALKLDEKQLKLLSRKAAVGKKDIYTVLPYPAPSPYKPDRDMSGLNLSDLGFTKKDLADPDLLRRVLTGS